MPKALRRNIVVTNTQGVHSRPSMLVAQLIQKFDASVTIKTRDKTANAASVMQLVILAAIKGTELEVISQGPQAAEALDEICNLLISDFDAAYR